MACERDGAVKRDCSIKPRKRQRQGEEGRAEPNPKDAIQGLRQELALCYRLCERFKFHEGVCNHLSVEVPGENRLLLIAYGIHWSQATAEDILVIDFDGTVVEGVGEPERTGLVSHRAFHRALGEAATAVLHTHMPFATTLMGIRGARGRVLPVHQNFLKFDGWLAYDDDYGGIFDEAESDRTVKVAVRFREESGRSPRALLCANHGVFTFGRSIAEAWDNLYYLERLCEVQVRALSCVGGDETGLRLLSPGALKSGAALAEQDRPLSIEAHWKAVRTLVLPPASFEF